MASLTPWGTVLNILKLSKTAKYNTYTDLDGSSIEIELPDDQTEYIVEILVDGVALLAEEFTFTAPHTVTILTELDPAEIVEIYRSPFALTFIEELELKAERLIKTALLRYYDTSSWLTTSPSAYITDIVELMTASWLYLEAFGTKGEDYTFATMMKQANMMLDKIVKGDYLIPDANGNAIEQKAEAGDGAPHIDKDTVDDDYHQEFLPTYDPLHPEDKTENVDTDIDN